MAVRYIHWGIPPGMMFIDSFGYAITFPCGTTVRFTSKVFMYIDKWWFGRERRYIR